MPLAVFLFLQEPVEVTDVASTVCHGKDENQGGEVRPLPLLEEVLHTSEKALEFFAGPCR
jgi:hypothetical protein